MAQLVVFGGILFPNDEAVGDYAKELSETALDVLEHMDYVHEEEYAMMRYINMYNDYYSKGKTATFSAATFSAAPAPKQFAKKLSNPDGDEVQVGKNDLEKDDAKYGDPIIKPAVAKEILEFLWVYYFSYHEAEQRAKRKIKLKSFSAWFRVKKRIYAKANKAEVEKQNAVESRQSTRDEKVFLALRAKGKKDWKHYHLKVANTYANKKLHYNQMKHVVNWADNKIESLSWRDVFMFGNNQNVDLETLSKKFRMWSRFLYKDSNTGFGIPFQAHLAKRFQLLNELKDVGVAEIEAENTVDLT